MIIPGNPILRPTANRRGPQRRRRGLAPLAISLLVAAGLAGCPKPVLMVSPNSVNFSDGNVRQSIALLNAGGGEMHYTVAETVWQGAGNGWVLQEIPWLTVDPEDVEGVIGDTQQRVFLNVDRTGLASGNYEGGLRVVSDGGVYNIPVSLTVPTGGGGGDPGDGELQVSPTLLILSGLDGTASFTVTNTGNGLARWYTVVSGGATDTAPVQVAVSPTEAVTTAGAATTVAASVPEPSTFDNNYLDYRIEVRDKLTDVLIATVKLTVDVVGLPAVSVDPGLLDFGKEGFQLTFEVANTGDPNSFLDFGVFWKDESDNYTAFPAVKDALVAFVEAPAGMERVPGHPNDPYLNARQVGVTISRDGIEEDIEIRDLYVCAVNGTDANGNPTPNLQIPPAKVQVRVQAAPFVEGAENRSRPPSLTRFVFMLRDQRGIAANAADPLIKDKISFYITEDKFPLDPDESSRFVTGPETLKCNFVLLLDYTGSMYRAATEDPINRLQPGEAIKQMVEAAKQFLLDLPPAYRVAIMEYHDRLQVGRTIHGFDTDRNALMAALDAFDMPEAEHGASEIYDALSDATDALVNEDPADVLPFDDADVRAVVFVSDGWDTSSRIKSSELIDKMKKARVRAYPLGYSGRVSVPVNSARLIELAAETGGHSYYAPEVGDLARLLDTNRALTFARTDIDTGARTATIHLRNIAATAITWHATSALNWVSLAPLSGTIPPMQRTASGIITETGVRDLVVTLPPELAAGTYEGQFLIGSDGGDATVAVRAVIDAAGTVKAWTVYPHTGDTGRLWREFGGQVVLSYTSLFQEGNHTYNITAMYPDAKGESVSASFEKDGVYYPGDPLAGQISLATEGVKNGQADIFVRTDYVPRNITQFRFRFFADVPEYLTPTMTVSARLALRDRVQQALAADAVQLAPAGLLAGWRVINEGHGVYSVVTDPTNYLAFAAFGDMLQVTVPELNAGDAFALGFRVDNSIYYSPQGSGPSMTKYFLYPGGILNPKGMLEVANGARLASPAISIEAFDFRVNAEAPGIWDRDSDGWADFDDIAPDDAKRGDADRDGVPDLDDPAPNNPDVS